MKDEVELNSLPSEDKRPKRSQMAMNSDLTREQFKAREIEQSGPDPVAEIEDNSKTMAALQAQYRAMTVKGRKAQRNKLRAKLGLDNAPPPPRTRFVSLTNTRNQDPVEDKLYSIGKPDDQEEQ